MPKVDVDWHVIQRQCAQVTDRPPIHCQSYIAVLSQTSSTLLVIFPASFMKTGSLTIFRWRFLSDEWPLDADYDSGGSMYFAMIQYGFHVIQRVLYHPTTELRLDQTIELQQGFLSIRYGTELIIFLVDLKQ
jgi:hypothetical protein